jgi:hypothetical protein
MAYKLKPLRDYPDAVTSVNTLTQKPRPMYTTGYPRDGSCSRCGIACRIRTPNGICDSCRNSKGK